MPHEDNEHLNAWGMEQGKTTLSVCVIFIPDYLTWISSFDQLCCSRSSCCVRSSYTNELFTLFLLARKQYALWNTSINYWSWIRKQRAFYCDAGKVPSALRQPRHSIYPQWDICVTNGIENQSVNVDAYFIHAVEFPSYSVLECGQVSVYEIWSDVLYCTSHTCMHPLGIIARIVY